MKVIGLTGGVACGKSSVARRAAERGIPVIDTDAIAHDLLESDKAARKEVKAVLGTLDRAELRRKIFETPLLRTRLEEILHPRIEKSVNWELDRLRSHHPSPKLALVVVPLLFEAKWENRFDETLAVICSRENQIARLLSRDGISRELAEHMIAAQIPNEEKAERATETIRNDGDLKSLEEATDLWLNRRT